MTTLTYKRMLARERQRRYREKHRERINAERRAQYDPKARHDRHLTEYECKTKRGWLGRNTPKRRDVHV